MNPGNARTFFIIHSSFFIIHCSSLFILHYLIVLHYFTLHSSLFTLHLQRQSYTPRSRSCRHLRTYEDLRRNLRTFEDLKMKYPSQTNPTPSLTSNYQLLTHHSSFPIVNHSSFLILHSSFFIFFTAHPGTLQSAPPPISGKTCGFSGSPTARAPVPVPHTA